MTGEDAFKAVITAIIGLVSAAVSWLVKRVLDDREEIVVLKEEVKSLKKTADGQITQECVREVIEKALDKRDEQAAARRIEWDKRLSLEVKQAVQEEVERLTPKLVREVRAATTKHHPQDNSAS